MENSKRGHLPIRHEIKLSKKQSPKTDEELKRMLDIPYASVVGSIQYVVQCTRPDVAYALSVTNSSKQATTADSTMEVEYIAAFEAAKEVVWMKNYMQELGVVHSIGEPVVVFCDNNRAIAQEKQPKSHHRFKYILRHSIFLER
ncbi:Retrovirus-related Pol polyprotein from transposon TNT 1-94 [Sesamum angolense]|uniref:Retrovirus-related Pol polyprotein from transposon TNT 1-94 n=1 Tax=Sesamum angolense TaxID=2727404 RepID=A0AAE1W0I1_9LAMI|nr:Retrovirus-related Pol polyprotein from transposon TNT 1-94 [Sesamum angolense]